MTTAAEKVEKGARLFDQVAPGWYEHIDEETLSVVNPDKCPAAQVFGRFPEAVKYILFPEVDSYHEALHYVYENGLFCASNRNEEYTREWIKQARVRKFAYSHIDSLVTV